MENEIIFIVEDSLEGGFEAKAIGHSIYTQADSFEELKINIKEAVGIHFDAAEMPKLIRIHYVKDEVIAA